MLKLIITLLKDYVPTLIDKYLKDPGPELSNTQEDLINYEDYITASGDYPDRLNSDELTEDKIENAYVLLRKVNDLLAELGVKKVKVSSGFRTLAANKKAGGAKNSAHLSGEAIDLQDKDGSLDKLIEKNHLLLKKYGLWLESPVNTVGWTHCDTRNRAKRDKNIFIP